MIHDSLLIALHKTLLKVVKFQLKNVFQQKRGILHYNIIVCLNMEFVLTKKSPCQHNTYTTLTLPFKTHTHTQYIFYDYRLHN